MDFLRRLGEVMIVAVLFLVPVAGKAFTIAPAMADVSVEPGKAAVGTIVLTNDEDRPQTFYLGIQKFIPKGDHGQQEFLPPEDTIGIPQWLFLEHASVSLVPGQSKSIMYFLRPPQGTPPGGYYAAIFFSTRPPVPSQDRVVTASRVGFLLLAQVEGAFQKQIAVTDVSLTTPVRVSSLPIGVRVTIENQGNVHVMPRGRVRITNWLGKEVKQLPINKGQARVLPGSRRVMTATWQKEEPRAAKTFWESVREEVRNVGMGQYTMTVEVEGEPQARVVRVSVWPTHLLVVVLGGLVVLAGLLKGYRRWVLYRATTKKA